VTIQPAVVELPLWVVSRVTHMYRQIRAMASPLANTQLANPIVRQLQLAAWLGVAVCLLDVLALLAGVIS
jgi:hypothetical protein